MVITREWAMPSANTFTIPPIRNLVERVCFGKEVIVDPFANTSTIGTITNDLNPEMPTDYHEDALTFLRGLGDSIADVVLFDPPYSITQAAQLYADYGKDKLELNVANMGYWSAIKGEIARITKPLGSVVSCGWSSGGIGKRRGFELQEVLLVAHGGGRNDTIVCHETKAPTLFDNLQ